MVWIIVQDREVVKLQGNINDKVCAKESVSNSPGWEVSSFPCYS